MSSADLDRIRADQAVIRRAAGIDLPYGRQDVIANLVIAVWGALMTVWVTYAPADKPSTLMAPFAVLAVILVFGVALSYRRRALEPLYWREFRLAIVGGLVFLVANLVDLWWSWWTGAPKLLSGASTGFFVIGIGLLILAVSDCNRRHGLGIALPAMALGLVLPWCDSTRQELFVIGACVFFGGIGTAALQMCILRSHRLETQE